MSKIYGALDFWQGVTSEQVPAPLRFQHHACERSTYLDGPT